MVETSEQIEKVNRAELIRQYCLLIVSRLLPQEFQTKVASDNSLKKYHSSVEENVRLKERSQSISDLLQSVKRLLDKVKSEPDKNKVILALFQDDTEETRRLYDNLLGNVNIAVKAMHELSFARKADVLGVVLWVGIFLSVSIALPLLSGLPVTVPLVLTALLIGVAVGSWAFGVCDKLASNKVKAAHNASEKIHESSEPNSPLFFKSRVLPCAFKHALECQERATKEHLFLWVDRLH